MTTAFPSLEATFIRPQASSPSLERPRLYIDGEILPALYHWVVRIQRRTHYVETIVPAQHEIEAAVKGLTHQNDAFRKFAIEEGAVIVIGMNERGPLSEYPVTIRVDQDGAIAIPS